MEAACKDRLLGKGEALRFLTSPHLEVFLLLFPQPSPNSRPSPGKSCGAREPGRAAAPGFPLTTSGKAVPGGRACHSPPSTWRGTVASARRPTPAPPAAAPRDPRDAEGRLGGRAGSSVLPGRGGASARYPLARWESLALRAVCGAPRCACCPPPKNPRWKLEVNLQRKVRGKTILTAQNSVKLRFRSSIKCQWGNRLGAGCHKRFYFSVLILMSINCLTALKNLFYFLFLKFSFLLYFLFFSFFLSFLSFLFFSSFPSLFSLILSLPFPPSLLSVHKR